MMISVVIFILGAITGSFLNVCIYRIPLHKSIVSPPSACPQCSKVIPFYDNIPLISYILLRGRCRRCGLGIPYTYLVVELLTALAFTAIYLHTGLGVNLVIKSIFVAALIIVTFIDIEYRIIPDSISLPGVVAGIAFSFISPSPGVANSIIGAVAGGGSLFVVAGLYSLIRGREGMGGGDIKLLAMIGAFLGWRGMIVAIFLGSFIGAVTGIALMLVKGRDTKYAIPFGPFLSIASIIYIFKGSEIIGLYLSSSFSP